MSATCDDMIRLAERLADGATETEWRSASSRAYYGAFHKAKAIADRCLPTNPRPLGVHERLSERYMAHGTKGRAMAYMLIDLKRVRTLADYFLDEPFAQSDATNHIASSKAFFCKADEFIEMLQSPAASG